MTDIREKVARAICNAIDADPDVENAASLSACKDAADAALSACGHSELIAALSLLLDNYPIRDDDFEIARAALKAGGS